MERKPRQKLPFPPTSTAKSGDIYINLKLKDFFSSSVPAMLFIEQIDWRTSGVWPIKKKKNKLNTKTKRAFRFGLSSADLKSHQQNCALVKL